MDSAPTVSTDGISWLLVSDVDDTLTGDAAALEVLSAALVAHADTVVVALNSSRPWGSVERTVREVFPAGFPLAASVTAMGTQVRIGGAASAAWTAELGDWPRESIVSVVEGLGFSLHDAEYQTPLKASFAVPAGEAQTSVRAALAERGLGDGVGCRIIASGSDDLDILPPGGGKDHSTRFLHGALESATGRALRLVVAGDSANDLAMFEAAPRAIAVGNARAELVETMPKGRAYHATACHAAGVLEGLRHFGAIG